MNGIVYLNVRRVKIGCVCARYITQVCVRFKSNKNSENKTVDLVTWSLALKWGKRRIFIACSTNFENEASNFINFRFENGSI